MVRVKNEEGEMDIFLSLEGHKRKSDLNASDIAGLQASDIGMNQASFAKMSLQEKIDAAFDSFVNNEGEEVAVTSVAFGKYGENERVVDPERSARARKKVLSLLDLSGAIPTGTKIKSDQQVLDALNSQEHEVGVKIDPGLKNARGQTMPRVAYFMSPDEVETA
jgi:hypothetical protein